MTDYVKYNHLYFRVDMNDEIATGHVMRCLSIADELKVQGISSTFISADDNPKVLINSRGYELIVLNTLWSDMDSELTALEEIVADRNIQQLLIDSYYVTENYLKNVTALTETIYLDDLNAFIYPVDDVLCYANYYSKFNYESIYSDAFSNKKIEKMPEFYLGLKYVPLRQEFRHRKQKHISDEIKKLLVVSGGADPYHVIEHILSTLDIEKYDSIDAICGAYSEDYDKLDTLYSKVPSVHLHRSVSNLIDYMEKVDLAISAGGSTLYELCATGTPTITYSIADNQLDNVKQFDRDNLMTYAGDYRHEKIDVNGIIDGYTKAIRVERSKRMQELFFR